ncbi:PTS sugar transporter subunit IIC [Anaerobranca gottschalkii]|uniref:PTS system, mannose-specific IIC component n=1 Tax=Anaerobranca gottschalkii DSM 13577 TaxID=1120990 RepID=A0A1H9ZSX6_9FIRM|nr:PTS sugar transporter subunit IIC [Anaerobranca gottschalkii]SES84335.1 PTS system, mannose-specific IIC component [Anaerobranca gottschalkii DSM 13577]
MFLKFFLAALISAITYIDATAVGQTMISRPIVSAPIIGLILGDLQTGILVGVLLELLWVGTLPVGATVPPESTFAAVNTVAIAILTGFTDVSSLILIFIFLIPFLYIASFFEDKIRGKNNKLTIIAEKLIEEGKLDKLVRLHFLGLSRFFSKTFIISLIAVTIGYYIIPPVYQDLPQSFYNTLEIGGKILPILGVAVVIDLLINKRNLYFLFLGLLLGLFNVNLWLLLLISIVAVILYLLFLRGGDFE